ncbi:phage portal protein [Methylocystis parvus]|uniref:phage portal protein n=1 Tax=Methylocystis parvus TaxID=134 RepID=UPI003C781B33
MFGFSKRERLARQVEEARLENELAELRGKIQNAGTTATYPVSDPLAFEKLFGPARPGVSADSALQHSAVYRCVFLIAGCVAMLPFALYKKGAKGHRERLEDHPLAKLIDKRPNPRLSPSIFWRSTVSDMLLSGNGVTWIERKGARPIALHFVPWTRAGVRLDRILGEPTQIYTLTLDDGRLITAHQDDVMHFPGSTQWQIFRAFSPLTAYAMSVGIGISADAFAKSYFDNGSSPDGYITYPNGISKAKDQADEIRNHWMAKHGGANRFAGPAVLTDGGKFEPIKINAADAQLLEARKFSVEDIARIFGVPPHLLGQLDKATSFGKGLEEMSQSFLDFTLGPHLQAIEDEVNYKLIRDDSLVAEFDREAFVRGDLLSRMEAYRTALGGNNGPGIMSQNEVRARLNIGLRDDPRADELVCWNAPGECEHEAAEPADEAAEEAQEQEPPAPAPAKPRKSRNRARAR